MVMRAWCAWAVAVSLVAACGSKSTTNSSASSSNGAGDATSGGDVGGSASSGQAGAGGAPTSSSSGTGAGWSAVGGNVGVRNGPEVVWVNELEQPGGNDTGLSFRHIDVGTDDAPVIVGRIYYDAYFGGPEVECDECRDAAIAAYSADGDHLWTLPLLSSVDAEEVETAGLELDDAGGIYVAGSFHGTLTVGQTALVGAVDDLFVLKLTPTGEVAWTKLATGPGLSFVRGIDVTPSGDVAVVGAVESGLSLGGAPLVGASPVPFVARFDTGGTHLYSHSLPAGFQPQSVAMDGTRTFVGGQSDGSMMLSGTAYPAQAPVVVEVLETGEILEHFSRVDTKASVYRMAVQPEGHLRLSGLLRGTMQVGADAIASENPSSLLWQSALYAAGLQGPASSGWARVYGDSAVNQPNWGPAGATLSYGRYDGSAWIGSYVARIVPPGSPLDWQLGLDLFSGTVGEGPNDSVYLAGIFDPAQVLPGGVTVEGPAIVRLDMP